MNLEEQLKKFRLSKSEYELITDLLGRGPDGLEWAVFSALWSEHCSYKSSKIHLKKLYNKSRHVLQSMGENAGVVDLGEGEKVAFKMESHNHPSFIEPFQGAATGVGGILRDIFTMGARPVALANYLAFGDPSSAFMKRLLDGVVGGISGYGNCVGVPMLTGQTLFDTGYDENILVNALAVGLFCADDPIMSARGAKPGCVIVYLGARTGRDGIHGASMASESFEGSSQKKLPTIQIGDPFFEKLLIEATLEMIREGIVVSMQDMGAAGLTSSTFEMASSSGFGFEMDLGLVPLRDSSMTPEEILLSESQERMLLVCEPENTLRIQEIAKKWDLEASEIGKVVTGTKLLLKWHGEAVLEIDPHIVVERAPMYERPFVSEIPKILAKKFEWNAAEIEQVSPSVRAARESDKSWIYRQYDQRVGGSTEQDCSSTVGVLKLPSKRSLAVSLGGRPNWVLAHAFTGGMDAVLEPTLKMSLQGFEVVGLTDCLNFGNPERETVMTQFVHSLDGMNEVCRSLDIPIISGNVSFYNETKLKSIPPTPATGLVGVRRIVDASNIPSDRFVHPQKEAWLLTLPFRELFGQEVFDLGMSLSQLGEAINLLRDMSLGGEFETARVVGSSGLETTLESMIGSEVGFEWTSETELTRKYVAYQIVFTFKGEADIFSKAIKPFGVQIDKIGRTTRGIYKVRGQYLNCRQVLEVRSRKFPLFSEEYDLGAAVFGGSEKAIGNQNV